MLALNHASANAKTIYTSKSGFAIRIFMAETLQLGGNIDLSGFSEIDPATMVVVKKIVGNHAKRFAGIAAGFERLHITLKHVHGSDNKFELTARITAGGKGYSAEVTDINLFFTLDKVLKKVENEISR
jgi:hypothetical protein